jgi:hypothetical protein
MESLTGVKEAKLSLSGKPANRDYPQALSSEKHHFNMELSHSSACERCLEDASATRTVRGRDAAVGHCSRRQLSL